MKARLLANERLSQFMNDPTAHGLVIFLCGNCTVVLGAHDETDKCKVCGADHTTADNLIAAATMDHPALHSQ